MAKFFSNLNLVLLVGLALAVLIAIFPDSGYRPPTGDLMNGVLQWLHVFFGITWIGLLYYFNLIDPFRSMEINHDGFTSTFVANHVVCKRGIPKPSIIPGKPCIPSGPPVIISSSV